MTSFTYNRYSSESYESQYKRYLQNQDYVDQIDVSFSEAGAFIASVVTVQSREVRDAIANSSSELKESITEANRMVSDTLESGFGSLNDGLYKVRDEIHYLANLTGFGFTKVLEGQKITNSYLGNIQKLMRIPDSQKQRVYHIEEGLKYLRNALDGSKNNEFYEDALEEFKKAELIEKRDCLSLFQIGFIYLFSAKHFNAANAETYFRNSARYYRAEALVSGTNIANHLNPSVGNDFTFQHARALLFAAEACYHQRNFSEAVSLCSEAWKAVPSLLIAEFKKAKYLAADNQVKEAIAVLNEVIKLNPGFSMYISSDGDLISKPEIITFLRQLRDTAVREANSKYDVCYKNMLPQSQAKSYMADIKKLIEKNKFLEAKKAMAMFSEVRDWSIAEGAVISPEGEILAQVSQILFKGTVNEFVVFEKERISSLPKAKNLIQGQDIKRRRTELENAINTLNWKISNHQKELFAAWKPWLVFLAIDAPIVILALSLDGSGFGLALLRIVAGVALFIGGPILAIWLIILIVKSIAIQANISKLNTEITEKKRAIFKHNQELKKLK